MNLNYSPDFFQAQYLILIVFEGLKVDAFWCLADVLFFARSISFIFLFVHFTYIGIDSGINVVQSCIYLQKISMGAPRDEKAVGKLSE